MATKEYAGFADLAVRLAREAAGLVLERLGSRTVSHKADHSMVTDADEAAQSHILHGVYDCFPDHAFLGEEMISNDLTPPNVKSARFCWVVDPLDGTRNFVSGFPCFCTSIAVLDRGKPVVGVIYEPNLSRCYLAVLGNGATLDGHAIHTKAPERVCEKSVTNRAATVRERNSHTKPDRFLTGAARKEAFQTRSKEEFDMLLGIPSTKDPLTVRVVRTWAGTKGFVLRNLGSTAIHLGLVASGVLAGAFAKRCKIWDIAAGALLVQEAGGILTDPTGEDLFPYSFDSDRNADTSFLAAARSVHPQLLDSIRTTQS